MCGVVGAAAVVGHTCYLMWVRARSERIMEDDADFAAAVRAAAVALGRVFVVLHVFGGARRPGDFEEHLSRLAKAAALTVLICTVDLALSPLWDLGHLAALSGGVDRIRRCWDEHLHGAERRRRSLWKLLSSKEAS